MTPDILKCSFKYIFAVLVIFCSSKVVAQSFTLSGIIQDAHTKEPVAYASVYFLHSGIGKTADSTGKFTFSFSDAVNDTLVISYVGYEPFHEPINISGGDHDINVQMQRGKANNEVVVKTKINRGLFLWKKIMSKKKQYNRYNLPNFGYEAYNKLEVDFKNFKPEKAKKNFLLKPFAFVFDNIDSTS
jgi:hypothetical protein